MAKPIIGYALCRGGWSGSFEVLGVTSESYGQLHGRVLPADRLTHKAKRDIIHRFEPGTTEANALGASDRYKTEYARHTPGIEQAAKTLRDLQNQREFAAMDAAKTAPRSTAKELYGSDPPQSVPPTPWHGVDKPWTWRYVDDVATWCEPPPASRTAQCDRLIRGLDCLCGTPTAGLGDAAHVRCEYVRA